MNAELQGGRSLGKKLKAVCCAFNDPLLESADTMKDVINFIWEKLKGNRTEGSVSLIGAAGG